MQITSGTQVEQLNKQREHQEATSRVQYTQLQEQLHQMRLERDQERERTASLQQEIFQLQQTREASSQATVEQAKTLEKVWSFVQQLDKRVGEETQQRTQLQRELDLRVAEETQRRTQLQMELDKRVAKEVQQREALQQKVESYAQQIPSGQVPYENEHQAQQKSPVSFGSVVRQPVDIIPPLFGTATQGPTVSEQPVASTS